MLPVWRNISILGRIFKRYFTFAWSDTHYFVVDIFSVLWWKQFHAWLVWHLICANVFSVCCEVGPLNSETWGWYQGVWIEEQVLWVTRKLISWIWCNVQVIIFLLYNILICFNGLILVASSLILSVSIIQIARLSMLLWWLWRVIVSNLSVRPSACIAFLHLR